MIERNHIKKIIIYFLSILTFLLLWTLIAKSINASLILPPISYVFKEIISLVQKQNFWVNFFYTIGRVFLGFFISLALGIILGLLSGTFPSVKYFLDIPLTFIRSTPVVAIILVVSFWFKSNIIPVFVCVLMCLPIAVTSVTEGMKKNNENLLFMAQIYNFTSWQKFRYIKLYDLKPFIINAAISIFGLTWKVVVAGEVLSIPKFGFGSLMNTAQVHLETATVIAITLILVTSSFILEKLVSWTLKLILKRGGTK